MGLRFGEIVNIRCKHIQSGFIALDTSKNGDSRAIPITSQVALYLTTVNSTKTPEDYLFPAKNSEKRSPPSMIRKAFDKALQHANIQGFKFHDLRHTCASHLAMNGATQGELMEILGHRSPTMTKRYAHFSKEHISRVLQKTSNNLIGNSE